MLHNTGDAAADGAEQQQSGASGDGASPLQRMLMLRSTVGFQ